MIFSPAQILSARQLPARSRRCAFAMIAACVVTLAGAWLPAAKTHADLLRIGAPSPMFNASVLPTPWWIERHNIDYAIDESIDSDFADVQPGLNLATGLTTSRRLSLGADAWSFGSRATRFGSTHAPDAGAYSSISFDFKRQLLPETSSGNLALALGWALIDAQSGARGAPLLSLEGAVELGGRWSLYGQSAWLGDAGEIGAGWSGDTLEAGLSYNPNPDLSLRAGYRRSRIRLGESANGLDASESSGFIFGAGFRW